MGEPREIKSPSLEFPVVESLSAAKDQFLATVSHELRTPLSAVLLCAQMINQGLLENDQLKEATLAIEQRCTRSLQPPKSRSWP